MDLYIEHIGACFWLTGKVSLILWSDCEKKGKGQNCEAEIWMLILALQSCWSYFVNIIENADARKETFNQMPMYFLDHECEKSLTIQTFIEIQKLKQENVTVKSLKYQML